MNIPLSAGVSRGTVFLFLAAVWVGLQVGATASSPAAASVDLEAAELVEDVENPTVREYVRTNFEAFLMVADTSAAFAYDNRWWVRPWWVRPLGASIALVYAVGPVVNRERSVEA